MRTITQSLTQSVTHITSIASCDANYDKKPSGQVQSNGPLAVQTLLPAAQNLVIVRCVTIKFKSYFLKDIIQSSYSHIQIQIEANWHAGLFRDCNGVSNGRPLEAVSFTLHFF